ncbi:alpha/beta hydrolase [Flavobacterium sp. '19STA2R22 D10 B1']|uniref:alpha/beta hydrolase n=1 Tax=Flavobacterium aerium TaxID=3037261 RepID=UPI00278BE76B|nr:alpha/beta hydrolase [Flavobacterium sp. '19STA2R22 D10 B1']
MSKIPVYFMPGLAASPLIFERIQLPEDTFEIFLLEWAVPLDHETLPEYAARMVKNIKHENPVLVGVSFGGILVQEIAKIILVRKLIIISSVKTNLEFPRRMKIAKTTKAYKLVPTGLMQDIEKLGKYAFGDNKITQRLKLYELYLSVRNKKYLDWAIEQVILWDRTVADERVIHIHGDLDDVFPIKYIKSCVTVKGGTHVMILNKYKWINKNLPQIILEEQ